MSGGKACSCSERYEPLQDKRNQYGVERPGRLWRVGDRECNYSKFNGSHYTPSDWSSLFCLRCGAAWRSKASYVVGLPDMKEEELNVGPGYPNYDAAMKRLGREPLR